MHCIGLQVAHTGDSLMLIVQKGCTKALKNESLRVETFWFH